MPVKLSKFRTLREEPYPYIPGVGFGDTLVALRVTRADDDVPAVELVDSVMDSGELAVRGLVCVCGTAAVEVGEERVEAITDMVETDVVVTVDAKGEATSVGEIEVGGPV